MGLESVTSIDDLNVLWPLGSDQKLSGDDHIRAIKTALKTVTFLKSIQTFTASGTWTRPTGVKNILIMCLGGGAGGGGGIIANRSGGGGSGGGIGIKWLNVASIASATVTIGAGGAGGIVGGGLGSNGNSTSFITTGPVTQCLGIAGVAGVGDTSAPGLASPLTNNIGDIKFTGGNGQYGIYTATGQLAANGGQGGGTGGSAHSASAEANTGGGGGGGYTSSGGVQAGGAGGSGYCVVLEFGV